MLNEKIERDIISTKRGFSIIASIGCMTSALELICGVIPSLHFAGSERPVAFFDIIRFLPKISSVFGACVLIFALMNVVFTIVSDVPRIVCTVIAGGELVSLAAALFTLKTIGISVYSDAVYTLTTVIILEILVSLQSFAISLLAVQSEKKLYDKIEKKSKIAVLRRPDYKTAAAENRPKNMNNPEL